MSNPQFTHAGYFEGIGGFSLGAERAGIKTIYTCELDDFRHAWLKYYLPDAIHERDITTATGCYADIFTAGFPCQDISLANPRGKGLHGERSGLFFEFIKHVRAFKPRYVVLENSPMLIYSKEILTILREFALIGYDAEWQVISKRPLDYPDERERLILIAYCNEIGRPKNNKVFNKNAYNQVKQFFEKEKLYGDNISRMDSMELWRAFIARTLQDNTGLSPELVKNEIAAYGDAICPDVAQMAFELIKIFDNQ